MGADLSPPQVIKGSKVVGPIGLKVLKVRGGFESLRGRKKRSECPKVSLHCAIDVDNNEGL